jgi:glycosyltransferase involved in cell wall biosynthesis
VGGIRELVHDEDTGLLFRPEDIDHFCQQAARLLDSPSLRDELAERGRQFVLREKNWNVLAAKYAHAYAYAQAMMHGGGRQNRDYARE